MFPDSAYSIVFIHIGKSIPDFVPVALLQARTFNPTCPIILVANEGALANFTMTDPNANISFISCESLHQTEEHIHFRRYSDMNSQWRDGFWLYTSERFLYLQDLIIQHNLKNVFHLENDNMLYVDLQILLPIFTERYKGMAVTQDNDQRCIPGFVYIAGESVITQLARYFADHAGENNNDMEIIGRFKKYFGEEAIDNLPIIIDEYINQQKMVSADNHVAVEPQIYCRNIDLFNSIFDAAAIGQYLGGIDPRNGESRPGFVNESCVFNPSLLVYEWVEDLEGRKIPLAVYGGQKFRINNLHVHSKNLRQFASKIFR